MSSTTVDSHVTSGDTFYTGLTLLTGSDSDRCSRVQIPAQHGYLAECCRPVSSIDGHRHLRSARRGHELDCQHTEDARSVMLDRL